MCSVNPCFIFIEYKIEREKSMSEKTVNNDERVSFILYKSYIKQVRMLSNEQAGEWIKSVYEYVCTGTYEESDDFGVELMISLICNQLDVDARKYEETRERRREAGRKGGYQKAKNNSIAKNATNELANVAEKEIENEYENEIESEKENEIENEEGEEKDHDHDKEIEVEKKSETERNNLPGGDGGAPLADDSKIMFFTANQYPTTQQEIDKFQTLAHELFTRYNGKQPGPYDVERVFECVYSRIERPNGTYIASYDEQKAALLQYAFDMALKAGKVNWNYIGGIYHNFEKRGIKTVVDANLYEWQRTHSKQELGLYL